MLKIKWGFCRLYKSPWELLLQKRYLIRTINSRWCKKLSQHPRTNQNREFDSAVVWPLLCNTFKLTASSFFFDDSPLTCYYNSTSQLFNTELYFNPGQNSHQPDSWNNKPKSSLMSFGLMLVEQISLASSLCVRGACQNIDHKVYSMFWPKLV